MPAVQTHNPVPADSAKGTEQMGPQLMRITNHGQMKTWVSFALDFLEGNENRPIVLHTLPAVVPEATTTQPPEAAPKPANPSLATTTIPRLISVVEIIKREYIKTLEVKHSPRLLGLHQYNEIGDLEAIGLGTKTASPGDRANELMMALEGKNHVRQKQTPFMRITLSLSPLPDLVEKGATYQPPKIRTVSKSAKKRAKAKERKAKGKPDADASMVG